MKTLKQLLDEKGRDVWSLAPDDTVFDAIKLMAEKGIGALAILKSGSLIGMITERDYARKVILKEKSSKETSISDIMTTKVVYARSDQSIDECMALMTEKRVRHLPVFEERELIGIVSIGDLVKAIIAEQQFVIEQLEQYISG
jgi:CBS domain-containing protein